MATRTKSTTETMLGIEDNRRAIATQYSSVDGRVVRSNPNIVRSNVRPEGIPVATRRDEGRTVVNPILPEPMPGTLQDIPNQTASAGINWILPLMILGGFFAAAKLKKRKKNV